MVVARHLAFNNEIRVRVKAQVSSRLEKGYGILGLEDLEEAVHLCGVLVTTGFRWRDGSGVLVMSCKNHDVSVV